jgi:hypothetical protein
MRLESSHGLHFVTRSPAVPPLATFPEGTEEGIGSDAGSSTTATATRTTRACPTASRR